MAIFTRVALIIYGLAWQITAAPASNDDKVTGTASIGIPPLITFKDGNIGVNFLGFKASAGLGGLLTGDASQGGLHAEAGTPFGQRAVAGLGGTMSENGRSIGGLYAGATAGGGIGASAGLDGTVGEDGSFGRSYAGASAGNVGKTVVKETYKPAPGSVGVSASGALHIQKIPTTKIPDVEVVKEYSLPKTPVKSKVDTEVVKEVQPEELRKTYVERTVIPNYVEKIVQVPSYVEKTIRVPTVIEKRIKVPAPPTIIEKEVEVPQTVKTIVKTKQVAVHEPGVPDVATVVKTKTKIRRRPWINLRNRININSSDTPYYGGVVAGDASVNTVKSGTPLSGTYTTTVRKQFNGNLVRDIFNIPIATLGAVSNLVGNIAGGAAGSVSVSKSIST
ncbi:uncharacterized protein [Euwallacea similis]|uniref:uncharacterized protein n=1 Tax=Euwallacea similis TaxID=1736056 RepID=UPI00345008EE